MHQRAPSPHPRAPLRHLFTDDDHPPGMPTPFSPLPSFAEQSLCAVNIFSISQFEILKRKFHLAI